MKIGIIGSGIVAQVLAGGFIKHGHDVTIGTRNPYKLAEWKAKNPLARIGSFADAAKAGDLIVLAVKGTAAVEAIRTAGSEYLSSKIVMDVTNPIADLPPVNGVLRFFTSLDDSLMERLQREFFDIKFVKAFNSVGNAGMINPSFAGGRPTMFICGNDEAAKKTVSSIVVQFGWEAEDMGKVEAARAIEPLCMLWCIPGFLKND
jgi:predicted dinucleotide-binding enzyme